MKKRKTFLQEVKDLWNNLFTLPKVIRQIVSSFPFSARRNELTECNVVHDSILVCPSSSISCSETYAAQARQWHGSPCFFTLQYMLAVFINVLCQPPQQTNNKLLSTKRLLDWDLVPYSMLLYCHLSLVSSCQFL